MSLPTNKEQFDSAFNSFQEDYAKFQKGNKAAGTRARKSLMEISKLSKLLRVEIQETKNSEK